MSIFKGLSTRRNPSVPGKTTVFWLISIALLLAAAFAAANMDLNKVGEALLKADWRLVLLAACLNVLLLYVRILKWRFFFDPAGFPRFYNLTLSAFSAYTCNNVIPARIGIFIQLWLLREKEGLSASYILGTLVLLRIFDGATLAFIGLLVLLFLVVPSDNPYWDYLQQGGLIFSGLFIGLLLLLLLLHRQPWLKKLLGRWARNLVKKPFNGRIAGSLERFWQGFAVLDRPAYLLLVVALNIGFWLLCGLSIHLNLAAFSIDSGGFLLPLFILLAQAISFTIPTPAHIGPYHIATVAALSLLDISTELALSAAIVMHASFLLTNTVPGLVYLSRENIRLSSLSRKLDDANG